MIHGSHLTDAEMVDHLDGVLAPSRAAHLDRCTACRDEIGSLRAVASRAAGVTMPDPSPLFWDHFQARVRAAVLDTAPARAPWRGWLPRAELLWAGGAASLVMLVALVYSFSNPRPGQGLVILDREVAGVTQPLPATVDTTDEAASDPQLEEAWALVRSVAEDVRWDDVQAAGITVTSGAADGLVTEMTSAEQSELAQLLEGELRQAGM